MPWLLYPPLKAPSGTQCIGDSLGCTACLEILLPLLGIKPLFLSHSAQSLIPGLLNIWNIAFIAVLVILFFCPTSISAVWTICVYIHISDCVETGHELLVLANNTVSGMFLYILTVMWTVDCIFITGVHACWWLGEYVILGKTF